MNFHVSLFFCFVVLPTLAFALLAIVYSYRKLKHPIMELLKGKVLACTTLLLAISTVVNANTKTIAMMRVFGYSFRDCTDAVLNGYRPVAYLGFAVGTLYQYILIKLMVIVVFKEMESVPDYVFNWKAFVVILISFVLVYEAVMRCYSARIRKVSV